MKLKPGMLLCAKRSLFHSFMQWKVDNIVFVIGRSKFSQSNGPSWTLMYPDGLFVKYASRIIQQYFKQL